MTDSCIMILALLIYPHQNLLCLFVVCTSLTFSGYFYCLVRRGSELFGVSSKTDSGIRILALLIYPTRNTFRYFYSLIRSGSELFGVSAQTDSGIRILALLINPTRSYCTYLWCAPL